MLDNFNKLCILKKSCLKASVSGMKAINQVSKVLRVIYFFPFINEIKFIYCRNEIINGKISQYGILLARINNLSS